MAGDKQQQLARILASHGRHGDNMVAHIQASDIPVLMAAGKAGTINPKDHLLEFYPAGAMGGGSNPGGDRNGPAGRSGGGIGGGGKSGDSGGMGAASEGHAPGQMGVGGRIGTSGNYGSKSSNGGLPAGQLTIGGPARNYGDPYGINSPTGQALQAGGLSPDMASRALQSQRNYVGASQGFANRTPGQRLADALAGLLPGVSTTKPTLDNPASYAQGTYHQSFNPAGAVADVAGFASGIPGVGALGEQLVGRAYNALGGSNYSFGGGGIDPQTGQATSGWGGTGPGFGFGGGQSQSGANNPNGRPGDGRDSNLGGNAAPAVGTNAGPSVQGGAQQVAASFVAPQQPSFVNAQSAQNPYKGTPWENYPGNVWIGGGTGSRVMA